MLHTARPGQADLALAFGEAGAVGSRVFADAGGAADALGVVGVGAVPRRDRAAAGVADCVRARLQPVADRDAVVEDEAFAVPAALLGGDLFEVFQDAALEVENFRDALAQEIARRFFAADAPVQNIATRLPWKRSRFRAHQSGKAPKLAVPGSMAP